MYSNVYKHNHEFENKLKIKEKHNDEKTGICTARDKRKTIV